MYNVCMYICIYMCVCMYVYIYRWIQNCIENCIDDACFVLVLFFLISFSLSDCPFGLNQE